MSRYYGKGSGYGKGYLFYVDRKKKPIAESTEATNDFLVMVHEMNPEATVLQLKELITDRNKFILNPEAVEVLDAYIEAGEGDKVPRWR